MKKQGGRGGGCCLIKVGEWIYACYDIHSFLGDVVLEEEGSAGICYVLVLGK